MGERRVSAGSASRRDLAVIIWVTHTGPATAGSQVSAGSHMWPETRGYVTENVEQARPAPPTHSGCNLSNFLMIAC